MEMITVTEMLKWFISFNVYESEILVTCRFMPRKYKKTSLIHRNVISSQKYTYLDGLSTLSYACG